jgi:CRISPR-associated protein Cas1
VGTDGAYVHVSQGFVEIARGRDRLGSVAIDTVQSLMLATPRCSVSAETLVRLTTQGSPVVICDSRREPVAWVLPVAGHHLAAQRLRQQIACGPRVASRLWRQVVQCKVRAQARVLEAFDAPGVQAMRRIADRVKNGDPENREAEAARMYWTALCGPDFRRDRESPGINALLNYGYTILRTAMARAVTAAGLHPSLGIQHSNAANPLALADDFMEPFRPWVDALVHGWCVHHGEPATIEIAHKRLRSGVLAWRLYTETGRCPMHMAMERLVNAYVGVLQAHRRSLALPGLPACALIRELWMGNESASDVETTGDATD